ncbi:hypothetical protein [Streptomyces goshikiensis]|uniref:hypothetical protein n=1 Tax=Streptomyces goshikiensis TaxID=1942 RepID=UPI0033C96417
MWLRTSPLAEEAGLHDRSAAFENKLNDLPEGLKVKLAALIPEEFKANGCSSTSSRKMKTFAWSPSTLTSWPTP